MSTATDGRQAVIRRLQGTQESANQRLLKKHLPAWVISGVFHVVLVGHLKPPNINFLH